MITCEGSFFKFSNAAALYNLKISEEKKDVSNEKKIEQAIGSTYLYNREQESLQRSEAIKHKIDTYLLLNI